MTRAFAILAEGLALILGGTFAMRLGGFGALAALLSVGSVGGALVAAVLISSLGALFVRARWRPSPSPVGVAWP